MTWFSNHYECPECKTLWTSAWYATCNDDCPHCGMRNVQPSFSEDGEVEKQG